jgi:SAM-dependent methyltransferase
VIRAAALLVAIAVCPAQTADTKLADAYWEWEKTVPPSRSEDEAYRRYKAKLKTDGLSNAAIEDTIVRIKREGLRQEGEFYDGIYTKGSKSNLGPNVLLVEAVKNRKAGKALDVAMGQGRNAIFLAQQGWDVTGFDISGVGLQQARAKAKTAGLKINAVLASDTDFDFGVEKWDLIAVIYALEKRSARKVRDALKPGGIAVIESGHRKGLGVPFEYEGDELRDIFKGFGFSNTSKSPQKGTGATVRNRTRWCESLLRSPSV